MKILPISDTHYEFRVDEEAFVNSLAEADVLVAAGDIDMVRHLDQARDTFSRFADKYDHIIYVPGNHEYYRSDPNQVNGILRTIEQEIPQLVVLEPGKVAYVKEQRFIGATLWFPDGVYNGMRAHLLNDFRMIKNFVPWVYEQNVRAREWLRMKVGPADIVVTHHLPSMMSVADKFRTDGLNIFFVSDEENLISGQQPKLWIHGHTHEACDYRIGTTRIVCNPKGYPHEDKPFNPNLIIEV